MRCKRSLAERFWASIETVWRVTNDYLVRSEQPDLEEMGPVNCFKLTNRLSQTLHQTQWGPGIKHTASGEGELCGPGWIHFYQDPVLAIMMNPVHADFHNPRMWEAEASGTIVEDCGLKHGCTTLTTIREIAPPVVTLHQRVRFGILCALEVCRIEEWKKWATRWLSGVGREDIQEAIRVSRIVSSLWPNMPARQPDSHAAAEACLAAACFAVADNSNSLSGIDVCERAAEAALMSARQSATPLDLVALCHKATSEGTGENDATR